LGGEASERNLGRTVGVGAVEVKETPFEVKERGRVASSVEWGNPKGFSARKKKSI